MTTRPSVQSSIQENFIISQMRNIIVVSPSTLKTTILYDGIAKGDIHDYHIAVNKTLQTLKKCIVRLISIAA